MEKNLDNSSPKNEVRNWIFQYFAALSASLATFSTGIVLGWPSQITDRLLNNEMNFLITPDELGWICSSSSIGAAFLSLFIGSVCDRIGRKTTMLLMIIPLELGWLLIIFAENVWMLIFGRFFTGMVGGSFCVTVSIYIDEIAQKEVRGVLGGLTQFTIACGVIFSNIVGVYLSVKYFSTAAAVLPIVFGLIFVFMPETPVYLLMKSKPGKSMEVLKKLLGKSDVESEFKEIQKCLHTENKEFTIRDILSKKSTQKACVIGVGLAVLKVLSGIDSITSYLSHIFNNTNTSIGPQNAGIVTTTVQVLSIIPQALVVDRWGRKILLITSQFGMALCLCATALSLCLKNDNTHQILEYIPVVALCVYTLAFSIGIGPIGWIVQAEIFDETIKARAISVCTFLVWCLAFGNVKMFEVIESKSNVSVPLFVYAGVSFIGGFFVLILVPETRKKTFDDIEKLLAK